jgi:hypothetical protein
MLKQKLSSHILPLIESIKNWIIDNKIIAFFGLFFICLKLPLLGLPLYWDAPAYNDIRLMAPDGIKYFFPWNTTSLGLNRHPNGLQFILYWFYQFFGYKISSAHIMSLFLSMLALFSYYELTKKFYTKQMAIITTVLISFCPIFFSQATQLLPDIPTVSLSVFSFYLFINKKYKWFIPISFLSGLISESALGFSGALVLVALIDFLRKKISLKEALYSFTPVLALVYYFIKQKLTTGDLIKHPAILGRQERFGFSWLDINHENFNALNNMNAFIEHNSYGPLLFLALLAIIFMLLKLKTNFNRFILFLVTSSVAYYAFFFIYGDYHPRNIFPIYILIYFLYGFITTKLMQINKFLGSALLTFVLFLTLSISLKPFHTGDSIYSSYIEEVNLCRDLFDYIKKEKLKGSFYATFPIAYFFEDLGSGYVDRKRVIHTYYSDGQWNLPGLKRTKYIVMTNIEGNDKHEIVHNYIKENNFKLIYQLQSGQARAWIFERPL